MTTQIPTTPTTTPCPSHPPPILTSLPVTPTLIATAQILRHHPSILSMTLRKLSPPSSPARFVSCCSTNPSPLPVNTCVSLLPPPSRSHLPQTFCSKCLQRSLDHSMLCPLCRQEFPGFAYFQEHPHNKIIISLREPVTTFHCIPIHPFLLQSSELSPTPTLLAAM